MKKNEGIVCAMLLLVALITGCTKSAPKDYSASIKGKTWWGTITYTAKSPEYYCVHFNDDSTLSWSQQPDNYTGRWILDGKHLTIGFTSNSANIQADISNDDKLTNIRDNTNYYEINSGQLIPNPNFLLENTVWEGTYGVSPYQITFLDGSNIKEKIGITEYSGYYTRSASGAVITYRSYSAYDIMGVFTSDNILKGRDDFGHMMDLVKQ